MSVNKAILVGKLGRDPELRSTSTGKQLCTFTLATTERSTDDDGQKQEFTTWHNIVAWGRQAEVMHQYLTKGSRVYIEGRIVNRSYDDRDGNRRYVSEVVVQNFEFIGSRQEKPEEEMPAKQPKQVRAAQSRRGDDQSDLPF